MPTKQQVQTWVEGYVQAWGSNAPQDIRSLFTTEAEYHEWPYETAWVGRDEIVRGWLGREASGNRAAGPSSGPSS